MMSPPIAALSIRDTAETSGIGRSTLYELIAQGRGPRVLKINRRGQPVAVSAICRIY